MFGLVWFVFFSGLWHETLDVDFGPNEKIITVFWFNKSLNLSCAVPFFGCYRLGLGSRASSRMHTLFWFRQKNTFGITKASTPLWPFDASHPQSSKGRAVILCQAAAAAAADDAREGALQSDAW